MYLINFVDEKKRFVGSFKFENGTFTQDFNEVLTFNVETSTFKVSRFKAQAEMPISLLKDLVLLGCLEDEIKAMDYHGCEVSFHSKAKIVVQPPQPRDVFYLSSGGFLEKKTLLGFHSSTHDSDWDLYFYDFLVEEEEELEELEDVNGVTFFDGFDKGTFLVMEKGKRMFIVDELQTEVLEETVKFYHANHNRSVLDARFRFDMKKLLEMWESSHLGDLRSMLKKFL